MDSLHFLALPLHQRLIQSNATTSTNTHCVFTWPVKPVTLYGAAESVSSSPIIQCFSKSSLNGFLTACATGPPAAFRLSLTSLPPFSSVDVQGALSMRTYAVDLLRNTASYDPPANLKV